MSKEKNKLTPEQKAFKNGEEYRHLISQGLNWAQNAGYKIVKREVDKAKENLSLANGFYKKAKNLLQKYFPNEEPTDLDSKFLIKSIDEKTKRLEGLEATLQNE